MFSKLGVCEITLTYTFTATGINEELLIDILSHTPLIAHCLNFSNDAETQQRKEMNNY